MGKISGIYKITCSCNKEYYIGSSKNIKRRIRKHFYNARKGKHDSRYFQFAYNKYGQNSFNWETVELVENIGNNFKLREQY